MEENSPQGIWDHIADKDAVGIRRKRTSYFPCNDSIVQMYSQKQRTRKTVDSLYCGLSINWNCFFASLFLPISSVFTEQLQTCVKNLKPIKIDRDNLMYWWGQSIVLSEIKAEIPLENDISSQPESFIAAIWRTNQIAFHKKTKWVNFVWMQDLHKLLRLNSISWQKILKNSSFQELVVNTLFQEMTESSQPKGMDSLKHKNWTCIGIDDQLSVRETWNWNQNLVSEAETMLTPGSAFLMDQINSWLIQTTTTQKFLQISLKNKRHNRLWRFSQPDKKKAKRQRRLVDLLSIPMNRLKVDWYWTRESPLSAYEISKKEINLLRHSQTVQREDDGAVQIWRIFYKIIFHKYFIGLMIVGRYAWQQEEEQKRRHQHCTDIQEQSFISELFKDIQDATLLILHYRTMWQFSVDSSNIFTT